MPQSYGKYQVASKPLQGKDSHNMYREANSPWLVTICM